MNLDPNNAAQPQGGAGGGGAATDPNAQGQAPQGGDTGTQGLNLADQAAQSAAAAVREADKPWYSSMPQEHHEALKGFGNIEDALAAIQRGQEMAAPKSADEIQLTLPEGIDPEAAKAGVDAFKEFCVKEGLPAPLAQKLLTWQNELNKQAQDAYLAEGERTLKALPGWQGDGYAKNKEQALTALSVLDRRMGGRLVPAAKANGMVNDPVVIEALYTISTLISEDSLGGGSPGAGGTKPPISREDAYKAAFGGK